MDRDNPAAAAAPTMDGFEWSPTPPGLLDVNTDREDGWCVRDAFSALLGWSPGSAEWKRFVIQWPAPAEIDRLIEHLGLRVFNVDPAEPRQWNELILLLNHPGIAWFNFPSYRKAHVVYVHHVHALLHHWPTIDGLPRMDLYTRGWPLGIKHLRRGPLLGRVVVDERQQSSVPAEP